MAGRVLPPPTPGTEGIPLDRPDVAATAPSPADAPRRSRRSPRPLGVVLIFCTAIAAFAVGDYLLKHTSLPPPATGKQGSLHLVLDVDRATVEIDDRVLPTKARTVEVPFLPAGPHTVVVRAPGRTTIARTVEVVANQTLTVRLDLR